MKIYPSSHRIKESNKVNFGDIPLSFIDTSNTKKEISIVKDARFAIPYSEVNVKAYEEFDNRDTYFFDENGNIITRDLLKRLGNKYVYEPQNAVEFTPLRFSFNALIKKGMTYKTDNHYNLKVAAHEEGSDLAFSKQLISIFGDAPRRGICPSNISINNQEMIPESLINSSYEENDFIFMKSSDGIHYKEGNVEKILDVDALLDMHVNIWISADSFESTMKKCEDKEISFVNTALYTTKNYTMNNYGYMFDSSIENKNYPFAKYSYSVLFYERSPVLLIEKPGAGFVIITHSSFFKNLYQNTKMFYEILMQTFFKSYYRTKSTTLWITDQPVDYIAYKNSKFNMRHEQVNLDDMLKNDYYNIDNEYTLVEIKTSNENVVFLSMGQNKDLFFYKVNNVQPDPIKSDGYISVYTSKHSVIHYRQEVIKKLETGVEITAEINENGSYIAISPCKSTSNKIYTKTTQTLKLESDDNYVLCYKQTVPPIETMFEVVPEKMYSSFNGVKIATISTMIAYDTKTIDVRINGGGIPNNDDPDYNMLDIGYINGRPYRVGSAMIIKVPKRLKEHEAKIIEAVNKHVTSGDYPIIVFY